MPKKIERGRALSTPYTVADIPFSSYPRPLMQRESYICLNGAWELSASIGDRKTAIGEITVPFPPESPASGIGMTLSPDERWIYERTVRLPLPQNGERVLLHIGAADQYTRVYVNEQQVAAHEGGYHAFSADITAVLCDGENAVRIEVADTLDTDLPYGKQCRRPHGMWYTAVSGIWQTVWAEYVPSEYIRGLKIDTTLDSLTVNVDGGAAHKRLFVQTPVGEIVTEFDGDAVTVPIPSPCLWSPESPYLYNITLEAGEDTVSSYAALRTIGIGEIAGKKRLLLNGKPYFFHGLLDQGYYPDGIFLPSSEEGYREDIARMKALGFNTLRKHIKIEPAVFYHECDKQGMLVFQDMVNNGRYSFLLDTALPTIGIKRGVAHPPGRTARANFKRDAAKTIAQLYNHPCVVYYTVFNEGWGQFEADRVYAALKARDPSRIWDATSGWFFGHDSDVQSEHVYFRPVKLKSGNRPLVLSEFGGYSCAVEGHAFCPEKPYGYRTFDNCEELTKGLLSLYRDEIVPAVREGLCAAILTQVSDVEEEINGMLTYDRQICKVDEKTMRGVATMLFEAFNIDI